MGGGYIFSLQPTFTQGLVLGQLSILVLLVLTLKYLFLDSTEYPFEKTSYHPRLDNDLPLENHRRVDSAGDPSSSRKDGYESAEWFTVLLSQVFEIYRSKLKNGSQGADGNEIARQRIERYLNGIRPTSFIDHIQIHSIDLGVASPKLSNARTSPTSRETELDVHYTDSVSVSLSTAYLFNYPMPSFARLPMSLTISLSKFRCSVVCSPPSVTSPSPAVSLTVRPNFILDLSTTSLMGSRAKLANVPKLHDLIQHQISRTLANRASLGWKIPLPGLVSVAEVKAEVEKEVKEEVMI